MPTRNATEQRTVRQIEVTGTEVWKDVIGYDGRYRVSSFGRVKSLARTRKTKGGGVCPLPERILSPRDKEGYQDVLLYKNEERVLRLVHHLVLEAFVGPCPPGMQCRHLNGKPWNNRLNNLCWGTSKQNHADRIRHGTSSVGVRNCKAKLTDDDVRKMRRLYATGRWSQQQLADRFDVCQTTAGRAIKGGWRHLTDA